MFHSLPVSLCDALSMAPKLDPTAVSNSPHMRNSGCRRFLPDWPKYSPDLNPQENVWSWVEEHLLRAEERSDSFETFCRKMLLVARQYPGGAALIPSMAERTEKVLGLKGWMSRY